MSEQQSKASAKKQPYDPVVVAGVRTPFMRSYKSYGNLSSYDLGRIALNGLMARTALDPELVEQLVMGTVIHDPRTPNVARECVLGAGLPATLPAYTVSLACISSNVAATSLADMIRLKRISVGILGGTDTCSDPPIRFSPALRKVLVRLGQLKKPQDIMKEWRMLSRLRFSDLAPDVPAVAEFSNGKTMGEGAEILAQQAGISREESDRFAERSHQCAVKAQADGIFDEDLIPVQVPPSFQTIDQDDGPRADTSYERLQKLKPAFDKKLGVSTAGSSSFLTDGASAVMMMSRKKAEDLSLTPKAVIRDYVYAAGDALSEMLTGPALSVPLLLARNKLKADDIGVWEIHEAFAAQVLANLKYMTQDHFVQNRLGLSQAPGEIPMEKINIWGGSLSIGHPFGATGGRLLWTAARRLVMEQQRYAVVTGCAAGGHGSAILLEHPDL